MPFTAVRLTDVFWAPRVETNRMGTIPAAFQKCEESGRVNNFERAAQALRGEPHDMKAPPYPFDDTALYKVIEGAAYVPTASSPVSRSRETRSSIRTRSSRTASTRARRGSASPAARAI